MSYCLAVFSSITYANRIKKILDSKIGYIALMHAPSGLAQKGCAYCLRFRKKYLNDVFNAAQKSGITIRDFYEETDNGYKKLDV